MVNYQLEKMRLEHCNLHTAIQSLNFTSIDQVHIPLGGRLEFFVQNWSKITSDQNILNHVMGYKIDFTGPPSQAKEPIGINLSVKEKETLGVEIKEMTEKRAVEVAQPSLKVENQYFSSHFVRPKKDGGSRPIFNLKKN